VASTVRLKLRGHGFLHDPFIIIGATHLLLANGFASKLRMSHLEEVSTVRGSGRVKRSFQNPSQFRMVIGNPSATADGTDFFQVRFWTFEAKHWRTLTRQELDLHNSRIEPPQLICSRFNGVGIAPTGIIRRSKIGEH
jgi:hypothetical protein